MLSALSLALDVSVVQAQSGSSVVITEIFYNPQGQQEGHEFLKPVNVSDSERVDMTGRRFTSGVSTTVRKERR